MAIQIWIDADAIPRAIRDIIFRAAERLQIQVTLVANQYLRLPKSDYIDMIAVPPRMDSADEKIIELVQPGDIVIPADIPLAAAVIEKDALVLSPVGKVYDAENIGNALMMRNFKAELRSSGQDTGGPPPLKPGDHEAFANLFDRLLRESQGR